MSESTGRVPEQNNSDFISVCPESVAAEFNKLLIEQYKLLASSAEQVSARRLTMNSAYIGINAAIISMYGVVSKLDSPQGTDWEVVLGPLGVAICVNWFYCVHSSKVLNGVKFQLLHEMEKKLPARVFVEEWRRLGALGYTKFTAIEKRIPVVVGVLYIILVAISVSK